MQTLPFPAKFPSGSSRSSRLYLLLGFPEGFSGKKSEIVNLVAKATRNSQLIGIALDTLVLKSATLEALSSDQAEPL